MNSDNNAIKLIIGNKSDLSEKREVTEEDRKFLEEQTGIDIIETSAKNSFKIEEAIEIITRKIIEKYEQVSCSKIIDKSKKQKIQLKI